MYIFAKNLKFSLKMIHDTKKKKKTKSCPPRKPTFPHHFQWHSITTNSNASASHYLPYPEKVVSPMSPIWL